MTKLSVNLNKVALLRNARNIGIPSVAKAAQICVSAGAHGITLHPRPDERHAKPSDVFDLAGFLATTSDVEFNVEGNPFPQFMEIVRNVKPTQCTLVPDSAKHPLGWGFGSDVPRADLGTWWDRVAAPVLAFPNQPDPAVRDLGLRPAGPATPGPAGQPARDDDPGPSPRPARRDPPEVAAAGGRPRRVLPIPAEQPAVSARDVLAHLWRRRGRAGSRR